MPGSAQRCSLLGMPNSVGDLFMLARVVLTVAVLAARSVIAAEPAMSLPRTAEASTTGVLERYVAEPRRWARQLRALARQGLGALPAPAVLAIADLQIRRGRMRSAASILETAVARRLGDPWEGWAGLGLGWIRLQQGRIEDARSHLASVAKTTGTRGDFAVLMLGLIDAAEGRSGAARGRLDAVIADASSIDLQQTARLGVGYAHYWNREYAEAATAWDVALPALRGSVLADDARYAAAIARHQAGDVATAMLMLRELAAGSPDSKGHCKRELVDLEPWEILKATFKTYRRSSGSLRPPESRVLELINLDGVSLARVAVRRVAETEQLSQSMYRADAHTTWTPPGSEVRSETLPSVALGQPSVRAVESTERRRQWPAFLVVGLVAAALLGRAWSHRLRSVRRHYDGV